MTASASLVIDDCAIATVDPQWTEHEAGYIAVQGTRIAEVGAGPAPDFAGEPRVVRATGCLATPGLINCHHHLYQWLTRGLAQQASLFEWLRDLYPVWSHIDAELEAVAARAGLSALLGSGCSTASDHHYVFPQGSDGLLEAEIAVASELGIRFHPCRGSMDLGAGNGGLPPDVVCEDADTILAATDAAINSWHDDSFDSMLRIAVAPCSPFSVTGDLMRRSAELARARGVRLHTHLAETIQEEEFCLAELGVRPAEYLDSLGWLGDDVWLAHCIHLSDQEVAKLGSTRTGVAHCPSSNARLGAGIAKAVPLMRAGSPVGLGVDGGASNESGELGREMKEALLFARLAGGPRAMTVRGALALGTIEGARCLGREREIGSLETGKLADIALWRLDSGTHAGIEDPVAALVLGPEQRVERLFVNGRAVVENGHTTAVDAISVAADLTKASRRLREAAAS